MAMTEGIVVADAGPLIIRSIRRGQLTPAEALTMLRNIPTQTTLHMRPGLLTEVIDKVAAEYHL